MLEPRFRILDLSRRFPGGHFTYNSNLKSNITKYSVQGQTNEKNYLLNISFQFVFFILPKLNRNILDLICLSMFQVMCNAFAQCFPLALKDWGVYKVQKGRALVVALHPRAASCFGVEMMKNSVAGSQPWNPEMRG